MLSASDIEMCFGPARGYSGPDAWEELEAATGPLPADYKEFVAGYGPGVVGGFLRGLHPYSAGLGMFDTIMAMAPLHQELVPDGIPHLVFPARGGIVQWADTVEGDACFLIPGTAGTSHAGVWFRQWAQWEEYEDGVPAWLVRQVTGALVVPGLPLRVRGRFAPAD